MIRIWRWLIGGFNQKQAEALPPHYYYYYYYYYEWNLLRRIVNHLSLVSVEKNEISSHKNTQKVLSWESLHLLRYASNRLSARASPQTPLGELTAGALPQTREREHTTLLQTAWLPIRLGPAVPYPSPSSTSWTSLTYLDPVLWLLLHYLMVPPSRIWLATWLILDL